MKLKIFWQIFKKLFKTKVFKTDKFINFCSKKKKNLVTFLAKS